MSDRHREQRRVAAAEHAAALERQRMRETERAQQIVDAFVRDARERGIQSVPLFAHPVGSRARYRTDLAGWYLKSDESLAIGTDGGFYVLTVPRSIRGWTRGVTVDRTDPPLQVGRGARDGESVELVELLRQRLEAG